MLHFLALAPALMSVEKSLDWNKYTSTDQENTQAFFFIHHTPTFTDTGPPTGFQYLFPFFSLKKSNFSKSNDWNLG